MMRRFLGRAGESLARCRPGRCEAVRRASRRAAGSIAIGGDGIGYVGDGASVADSFPGHGLGAAVVWTPAAFAGRCRQAASRWHLGGAENGATADWVRFKSQERIQKRMDHRLGVLHNGRSMVELPACVLPHENNLMVSASVVL